MFFSYRDDTLFVKSTDFKNKYKKKMANTIFNIRENTY